MNNTNSQNQNSDIHIQKKESRKKIKEIWKSVSQEEINLSSNLVFSKLETLDEFKKAKNIFIFWSLPDELSTQNFIEKWCESKLFLLPSVSGDDMILKKYTGTNHLIEGNLGISEPEKTDTFEGNIDLVIVPGVAFDKSKNRLGRGKGFYDRFLNLNNVFKIGICADFQLLDSLPVKNHDAKMDLIITPSKTIR